MNPTPETPGLKKTPGDNPFVKGIIEDTEAYWRNKERVAAMSDPAKLVAAVDAFGVFLNELNSSIGKLRKEFEKLS
jgi:hypothetical protein